MLCDTLLYLSRCMVICVDGIMKHRVGVTLGALFALACGIATWLLAGAPGLRFQHSEPTDTIRVMVENLEYHIPAELQPVFEPADAVLNWFEMPKGASIRRYSQESTAPPQPLKNVLITTNALKKLSEDDASYRRLRDLHYVAVLEPLEREEYLEKDIGNCQMPRRPLLPDGRSGSFSLIADFRAETVGDRMYFISTDRSPIEPPITASCHIWSVDGGFLGCNARRRIVSGGCIEISLNSRTTPIETLEDTFVQAELLIKSLTCGATSQLGKASESCK